MKEGHSSRRGFLFFFIFASATSVARADADADVAAAFADGVRLLFEGRPAESALAFDRVVAARPALEPELWQRGIALYYAGRFTDGRRQFEIHRGANPADVENVAWHQGRRKGGVAAMTPRRFEPGAVARGRGSVALASLVVAGCLVGCGYRRPGLAHVTGVVTVDTVPVEGASVSFRPIGGGRHANGTTGKDGRFQLSSYGARDGAALGKHRVTVTKMVPSKAGAKRLEQARTAGIDMSLIEMSAGDYENLLPARYADPATSGLEVEVSSWMKPVTLRLRSAPNPGTVRDGPRP